MKHAVVMGSASVVCTLSFIKISLGSQGYCFNSLRAYNVVFLMRHTHKACC
jgi:hypothetical protein